MFENARLITGDSAAYTSVESLLGQDDLPEVDITIPRWGAKLRLKALDLEQQLAIQYAALRKNNKTGQWERNQVEFCAQTWHIACRVPTLDLAQARLLAKKNPIIITEVTDLIWALAAFTPDALEAAAHALAPTDPAAPASDDAGGDDGADDSERGAGV